MSELSELLERNHFRHRCSICGAVEAERDTAISERTEARAEAFRAQERVRELEEILLEYKRRGYGEITSRNIEVIKEADRIAERRAGRAT